MNKEEIDLVSLNKKFSADEFEKLKPGQQAAYKNELKQILNRLKNQYNVKLLDDDYLFSIAATKATYNLMQLINEFRDLTFKLKTSAKQQNAKQASELTQKHNALRKQLTEVLFGSYLLLNKIDGKTIAINQVILNKIMGMG